MMVDDYLDYLHEGSKKKVLGAAVATALTILGVTLQAYKKLMDGAEKACKDSPDKETCIITFRHAAYKRRVASLKKRMSKCTKTTNPGKCRKYIRKTITSLRRRIR
ncbi:MAG: hypothetical protein ACTSVO_15240 [Candidatus Heimdallarchaeaceae archaeon]